MTMTMTPSVVCIMGPTASGKSDLAVAVARRFQGQVVNADSMQVFADLPIGTAAPTADMLAAVPHHLFGYLRPDQPPDAGLWARDAARTIREIAAQGHLPIVVGGTFFWMRALFEGLSRIPAVTDAIRAQVAADMQALGAPAAHARLARLDPLLAGRLHPRDTQRIARGLEVVLATGTPLSTFQEDAPEPPLTARVLRLILEVPRARLYARIERRLDQMFVDGLVDEVARVLAAGLAPTARPLRSSSYAPVVDFLAGRCDRDAMRARIAQGHRNYAKRQITWLKREEGTRLPAGNEVEAFGAVASFLAAQR